MPLRDGALLARDSLRSWSQKNFASASRARRTRSLPATIALPPSSASILATTPKRGASEPSSFNSEKYFWCDRIDVISTSSGTSINSLSIVPRRTTGHSTNPVTSSNRPGSLRTVKPTSLASAVRSASIFARRCAGSSITFASDNPALYVSNLLAMNVPSDMKR